MIIRFRNGVAPPRSRRRSAPRCLYRRPGRRYIPQNGQRHCPSDTVVWLNTSSATYHFTGDKWYGHGTYVCKTEADKTANTPNSRRARIRGFGYVVGCAPGRPSVAVIPTTSTKGNYYFRRFFRQWFQSTASVWISLSAGARPTNTPHPALSPGGAREEWRVGAGSVAGGPLQLPVVRGKEKWRLPPRGGRAGGVTGVGGRSRSRPGGRC